MVKPKEIVILSGKGGTGKTSFASSLAVIAEKEAVIADCDVDAANMHIVLNPKNIIKESFRSGYLPVIDNDKCVKCNRCVDVCRFDALHFNDGLLIVDSINCEGCGYCQKVCNYGAISSVVPQRGDYYLSMSKMGSYFSHAKLGIGEDNSGKLVAKVKAEAKRIAEESNTKFIIVDGAPGIGCPVVSSLSGAHLVVLVTEPTMSGFHDLKRVLEVIKRFNPKICCIINKHNINSRVTEEIESYIISNNISLLDKIEFDPLFAKAMMESKSVVEISDLYKSKFINYWEKIKNRLDN